jgi:hypothetical protein
MSAPRLQSFMGSLQPEKLLSRLKVQCSRGKYSTAPAGTAGGNGFASLILSLQGEQLCHGDRPCPSIAVSYHLTFPLGLKPAVSSRHGTANVRNRK